MINRIRNNLAYDAHHASGTGQARPYASGHDYALGSDFAGLLVSNTLGPQGFEFRQPGRNRRVVGNQASATVAFELAF